MNTKLLYARDVTASICNYYEENGEFWAQELTVCIFNCKKNNARFKHYCGSNGLWDRPLAEQTCNFLPVFNHCTDPNTLYPDWTWNCQNSTKAKHRRNEKNLDVGTTCSGACKLLDIQTEIHCDGTWDIDENENFLCQNPALEVKDPCPQFHFDDQNGSLSCTYYEEKPKSRIVKSCVLNCDPGFAAFPSEIFLCGLDHKGTTYEWTNGLGRGVSLDTFSPSFNVTCDPTVAVIAGGT